LDEKYEEELINVEFFLEMNKYKKYFKKDIVSDFHEI
jgi:hypothetical protein